MGTKTEVRSCGAVCVLFCMMMGCLLLESGLDIYISYMCISEYFVQKQKMMTIDYYDILMNR